MIGRVLSFETEDYQAKVERGNVYCRQAMHICFSHPQPLPLPLTQPHTAKLPKCFQSISEMLCSDRGRCASTPGTLLLVVRGFAGQPQSCTGGAVPAECPTGPRVAR